MMTNSHSLDQPEAPVGEGAMQDAGLPPKKPAKEEPAMVLEADLPSDGRDEVGEAMIRNLPQRPELSEPPSQAHATHPQP
jgi:hypothetical protein